MLRHETNTGSTASINSIENWGEAINEAYFPLSLRSQTGRGSHFTGRLSDIQLGHLGVSTLESDPVTYVRDRYHIGKENSDYFLVTFPELAAVQFTQNGREVVCHPGEFLLEGSSDPYVFRYKEANRLKVVRVPGQLIRDRVRAVDDLCANCYPAGQAIGGLFNGFLNSVSAELGGIDECMHLQLSDQIIDLLCLVLGADVPANHGTESAARDAHLHRIYRYLNAELGNPELSTRVIANQCGISLRYLHQLFEPTGQSVSKWVRERRLEKCNEVLTDPGLPMRSIGELAYRWGFSDQAHFCRLFKTKYGQTPGQVRAASLERNMAILALNAEKVP